MSSAFELLQGAKIFTKLDLRYACNNVKIKLSVFSEVPQIPAVFM